MNRPLSALLVDDEDLARLHLRTLLEEHGGITIAGEAADIKEAARLAKSCQADVIFLDIDLPPHTGFDLLPELDSAQRIVFVTAYDQYAVRAFEINSLDYLLKPVSPDRLRETIRRFGADRPPEEPSESSSEQLVLADPVVLRDGHRIKLTEVRHIVAIKAEGTYTRVHLADGDSLVVLKPISAWKSCLPDPPFLRLDRSLMINRDALSAIQVFSRDETKLTFRGLSLSFTLGRAASSRLRSAMSDR
jgi:two-component system LytT family response regulator